MCFMPFPPLSCIASVFRRRNGLNVRTRKSSREELSRCQGNCRSLRCGLSHVTSVNSLFFSLFDSHQVLELLRAYLSSLCHDSKFECIKMKAVSCLTQLS